MSLPLHGEWRCFGVCRLQSGPAICEKRGHMLDSITDTVFPRSVDKSPWPAITARQCAGLLSVDALFPDTMIMVRCWKFFAAVQMGPTMPVPSSMEPVAVSGLRWDIAVLSPTH